MKHLTCFALMLFAAVCAAAQSPEESPLPEEAASLHALLRAEKNSKTRARILSALSDHYQNNIIFDSAVYYKLEGVKLAKENLRKSDTSWRRPLAKTLFSVAQMYITTGQCEQGKDYAQQGREFSGDDTDLKVKFYRLMAESLRMYAQAGAKDISECFVYYDSLTQAAREHLSNAAGLRAAVDLGLTSYYVSKNDIKNALKHVARADSLAPYYDDETLQSQVKYMYGDVYYNDGQFAKALPLLTSIEKQAESWGPGLYVELLRNLAKCYAGMGDYKTAYEYYNKFAPLRDSIYTKAADQSFSEAEAKFQNKDKQLQIELKNVQLDENRKERVWLISGLALLGLVAGLLIMIYRNKKRTADILNTNNRKLETLNAALEEANQTKAKLFSIISHDLRSPISQVYQFLKLQQLNPELLDEQQKNELSNRIQNATGSLLETMEDLLLWSKTQMQEFKPSPEQVHLRDAVQQATGLVQLNISAKNISLLNEVTADVVFFTDPYYLQTLLRNILQNAVKASPENDSIRITVAGNKLTVRNSGKAFSSADFEQAVASSETDKTLHGLGLKLISELSAKSGIRVEYADVEEGACAELYFPEK